MSAAIQFIWLIPLLPALGFLIVGLFGRRMGKGTVRTIACGSVGLAFVVSALCALPILSGSLDKSALQGDGISVNEAGRSVEVNVGEWLSAGEPTKCDVIIPIH